MILEEGEGVENVEKLDVEYIFYIKLRNILKGVLILVTNYVKGRAKEYHAIYQLEALGYTCMRAASSKGAFDVIAWKEGQGPRMIQCKREGNPTNKTYPAERRMLFNTPVPLEATRELWVWNNAIRSWRLKLLVTGETSYGVMDQVLCKLKPKGRPVKPAVPTKPRKGLTHASVV